MADRPEALPGATAGSLATRLGAFLDTFRTGFVGLPVQEAMRQLGTYVTMADLTLAAGQPEAALQQAIEARRAVEAGARDLKERLITLANYENLARFLLAEDASLRVRLADRSISEDTRRTLLGTLDATGATIGPALALPGFALAYAELLDSGTAVARARANTGATGAGRSRARVGGDQQRAGAEGHGHRPTGPARACGAARSLPQTCPCGVAHAGRDRA